MQTPFLREQVELTHAELDELDVLTRVYERNEEHVLNPALMLYITR